MRYSGSATAVFFATLLVVCVSVEAAPPPGCKRTLHEVADLEASLTREIKVPYDPDVDKLKSCYVTQPLVSQSVRRAGQPSVAIFVFDVTGSGRVMGLQLIGKKSPWAEVAQEEVSQWLFEPRVEGDVGITRVGVTVVLVAEIEGRGLSCGKVQSPVKPDLEIRVCASR